MIGFKSVKCDMRVWRVPVTHYVGFSEKNIFTLCVTFVTYVTFMTMQSLSNLRKNSLFYISFRDTCDLVTPSIRSIFFNHVTYVTYVTCFTYVTCVTYVTHSRNPFLSYVTHFTHVTYVTWLKKIFFMEWASVSWNEI